MRLAPETITGHTLSQAWLNSLIAVDEAPDRRAFHLVTRVVDSAAEDPIIRAAADRLLADLGHDLVETVANTIFPNRLAATCADHRVLADRYRAMYPTLRRLGNGNDRGTYFGRLVAYPTANGMWNQLADLIEKLASERAGSRPKSARFYEASFSEHQVTASTLAHSATGEGERSGISLNEDLEIYTPGTDKSIIGFPCLSWCSFQLDGDRLHLVAHYRSQYLVQRGYGNYLGLARLQRYVADATGLMPGQLLIVAGYAKADATRRSINKAVQAATNA